MFLLTATLAAEGGRHARYVELLSGIAPLPCRDDLVTLAQANFSHHARALEVGVFRGEFAKHNLGV